MNTFDANWKAFNNWLFTDFVVSHSERLRKTFQGLKVFNNYSSSPNGF